jgi:TM2 domain-containing membrane protein YozV
VQGYPPGGGYGPPPQPPGYGPPGYGPPGYQQWSTHGHAQPPAQPLAQYAPYGYHPRLGVPYSDKQKVLAGVLGIFLGKFGVGRFYTGHTSLAVAQLITCLLGVWVFSWFTCGLSIFVLLWPVIDGIVLLATDSLDSDGRALR